jgi:hypothetical protein
MKYVLTSQRLRNLLVDDDIDIYASLGSSSQHVVEAILLIARRWPSKIQLWA